MTSSPSASHLRFNPLLGRWILVSPQRGKRPQSEKDEASPPACDIPYDPTCYLCPGNARTTGARNPAYTSVFVFDNDFPALSREPIAEADVLSGLLQHRGERGICRVLCYSPRHDLPPAMLPREQMRAAIDAWANEYETLGATDWIGYVQIFENRGAIGGASSRHPHSQIWASADIPPDPLAEQDNQKSYSEAHGGCLLCDYLMLELSLKQRIVCQNDGFVALVPYWAVWPFETMVIPRNHFGAISEMNPGTRDLFADIVRRLTTRYDNLFRIPFPYSMAMHQSPTDGFKHPEWHFHLHYFSPMRSATVQKVMAAYELGAGPERDDLPENAAKALHAASEVHFLTC
ncbi:MAG TPA: galactose-1-phosphate uridylyltransferase [Rhizomicrobium sp.]|nr:galactose-1-phosphate uridylyltransferase [Rhizomicrobium sp.]